MLFRSCRFTYLRDAWCKLDFVVVTFAWAPILLPGFGNFTGLRVLRALRPLRTLRIVPGMPVLINSIISSIPGLGTVAMLCSAFFLIFGIIGTSLFEGALHYQCVDPITLLPRSAGAGRRLATSHVRRLKGGSSGGSALKVDFCHMDDPSICPSGTSCHYFATNPEGHAVNFDSVIDSCMALLQARRTTLTSNPNLKPNLID